jgi:uncharacterized protein (TIGR02246 family)
MAVHDLKQLAPEFARAANAGDLDGLCELYTSDAVFVTGPDGAPAAGTAAIREVLAGLLASRPSMEFEHVYMHQTGDTALARGRWTLTHTGPDGTAVAGTGNSIEVLRRQADGSWRYIIDHPWGGDAT